MIQTVFATAVLSTLVTCVGVAQGQQERGKITTKPEKQESSMTNRLPKVGTPLPDLQIYQADGKPFATGQLKDQYTVLVFGCLT